MMLAFAVAIALVIAVAVFSGKAIAYGDVDPVISEVAEDEEVA